MPTYSYKCEACGARFDVFLLQSELGNEVVCTKCGDTNVQKQITVPSIRFEGEGFYKNTP